MDHARAGRAYDLLDLLARGLPPNLTNEKGDTLLMLAAYHGHGEVVRVLLEHGADAEAANDRKRLSAAAAYQGYTGKAELLLDLGADVNGWSAWTQRKVDSGSTRDRPLPGCQRRR